MRILFFLTIFFSFFFSSAQIKLRPSIGLTRRPNDGDTVARFLKLNYDGTEPGIKVGDMINHFRLYGLNNDSLDIATELSKGKPILLINASYTCPFFRKSIHFFDSIAENNKNINCFIIYTIEAHPDYPFICPYTNEASPVKMNEMENVYIKQHHYYSDRKAAAMHMKARTETKMPIFLDTPENAWLHTFGLMADMAYLIDKSGKVVFKYLGYKKQKKEICRDLDLIGKK